MQREPALSSRLLRGAPGGHVSIVPAPRGLLLAAAALPLALLPALASPRWWPLWPVALGALTLAFAADLLLAPRCRQLAAVVELPASMAIGEGGTARISLRAPWRLAVTVAVDLSDQLEAQPRLHGVAVGPAGGASGHAGGRGRRETLAFPDAREASEDPEGAETPEDTALLCRLVPRRRGRVGVERLWVRFGGPLGLLSRLAVIEVGREAIVTPDTRPVRAMALRFDDRSARLGLTVERYRGEGSEFDSLREHARGDDARTIDWKASAHHRRLVSRQHRAERNHQVVLAVDTGRLMAEPLDGVPRLDHAVTAALLLAYVSLRAGDRVGLAGFDARLDLWLAPRGGLDGFQALQRTAGRLGYSNAETNFTLALSSLDGRLTRRSLVVVLTDFVDTVTAELMRENLVRLARRHVVIFVALQDPGLAALAAAAPNDLLALNRAVVAAGLLRDREVVLRDLAQRGIHAIDAPPRQVQPRLVDSYLDIKRRERI